MKDIKKVKEGKKSRAQGNEFEKRIWDKEGHLTLNFLNWMGDAYLELPEGNYKIIIKKIGGQDAK